MAGSGRGGLVPGHLRIHHHRCGRDGRHRGPRRGPRRADLTIASITPNRALTTIPADTLDDLVGQRAATDLPEGTLVTPASVSESLTPPAGTALVGVTVSPAQLPAEPLRPGDTIRLVATPRPGDDLPGSAPQTFEASVVSATYLEETAQTTVDVQVATDDAAPIAALASTGRVAVVLDTRER